MHVSGCSDACALLTRWRVCLCPAVHGASPAAAHLPAHHWLLSSHCPGATYAQEELGTGEKTEGRLVRSHLVCFQGQREVVAQQQGVFSWAGGEVRIQLQLFGSKVVWWQQLCR